MLYIVFLEALPNAMQERQAWGKMDTLMQSRQGSLSKGDLGAATTTSWKGADVTIAKHENNADHTTMSDCSCAPCLKICGYVLHQKPLHQRVEIYCVYDRHLHNNRAYSWIAVL